MRPTPLRIQLNKEARALLVPWLACAVIVIVSTGYELSGAAVGLGCLALCALSIGHEYSYGTLSMWLAQPVSRPRLLLVKLSVLVASLVTLLALWMGAVQGLDHLHAFYGINLLRTWPSVVAVVGSSESVLGGLLVIVVGLSLTLWFTLLSRNLLAGVVFTCAACTATLFLSSLARGGHSTGAFDSQYEMYMATIRHGVLWRPGRLSGLLGLCAVGAVFGWRKFMALEAIDGRGQNIELPQWSRRAGAAGTTHALQARRSPLFLLVRKELHLQQVMFIMAAVVLSLLGAELASLHLGPEETNVTMWNLAIYSGFMIAIVIGALAGAEERHYGTAPWQILMPISARKQWMVKVATVVVLTTIFAGVLPHAVAWSHDVVTRQAARNIASNLELLLILITFALGSLYLSSWLSSSLKAALIATATLCGGFVLLSALGDALGLRLCLAVLGAIPTGARIDFGRTVLGWSSSTAWGVLVCVSAVPWFLHFGLVNYRSVERSTRLFCRQALPVVGGALLVLTLMSSCRYLGIHTMLNIQNQHSSTSR